MNVHVTKSTTRNFFGEKYFFLLLSRKKPLVLNHAPYDDMGNSSNIFYFIFQEKIIELN